MRRAVATVLAVIGVLSVVLLVLLAVAITRWLNDGVWTLD